MSYTTVAEADTVLGHLTAWTSLDAAVKQRHLDTAMLWLNVTYEWPGAIVACPVRVGYPYGIPPLLSVEDTTAYITPQWPRLEAGGGVVLDCDGCALTGVPLAIKRAEAIAAGHSASMKLFPDPTTPSEATQGTQTRKKIKAGSVEIDKEWASTESTSSAVSSSRGPLGQIVIPEVDVLLACIANRKGTQAPAPAAYCV